MMRCFTMYCLNDAEPKRKHCPKCRSRAWRLNNPLKATFNHLKSRSKQRGVPFELSLKDWAKFCSNTNYLKLRGKESHNASVDRVKAFDEKGFPMPYRIDNIQMLTLKDNTAKGNRERRKRKGWGITAQYAPGEVPF